MRKPGFFIRILLPSLMAILLFLAAIYIYVLPGYRENLMDKKRETIRELTATAWSVMQRLDETASDSLELILAKEEAREVIRGMRYGEQSKDYFWITDTAPKMIMHPYRPQLEGKMLSDYEDQEGKRFFVEIATLAKKTGNGYIDYKWQWKDDSLMVVPKLSYVKLYEPWGWIVGTGIYVEDVQSEITTITRQVVWISLFVTLVITAVIGYLARRNFLAEQQRQKALQKQRDTTEKYKKLVEASTDGVLMTLNGEVIYCNPYLLNLLGYTHEEAENHDPQFLNSLHCVLQIKNNHSHTTGTEIVKEQKIRKKNKVLVDVIISRSAFEMAGKDGFIYTIKDVSGHGDVERELDLTMDKFKSIADTMQIGVFRCTIGRNARFVEVNKKALEMLGYTSESEIKSLPVQQLFSERQEKKEVISAISEGTELKDRLLKIKKPDGSALPAMVTLFPVKDVHDKVVYCDGIVIDAYEHLSRHAGFSPKPMEQSLSAGILLQPVKNFLQTPPLCELTTPLEVAARLMSMNHSDIILVRDNSGEIIGLLTHSDISRRAVAKTMSITTPVSRIMSAPVISVSADAMVMEAFSLMIQNKISYVVIQSNEGECPGYISLPALSQLRKDTPEFLVNSIQQAGSVFEIAELTKQLPRLVALLAETGTGAATSGKLISRITDAVTDKIIHQAIRETGTPPAPFVFLVLGSEGRREQSLATDQDNAIVFLPQKENSGEELRKYFLELGNRICTHLNKAGYPFCEGKVMAMHPQWCLSLSEIKKSIAAWLETPNPAELLNAGIFFDFRPVFGDFDIAGKIQEYCLAEIKDKNRFFYNLAQNTIAHKPPLNVMGQVVFESDERNPEYLDIKKPLMALTGIMRLWALKYGVGERNTMARLQALRSAGVIQENTADEFSQALRYLMLLRIRNQLRNINVGNKPTNIIVAQQLSELDRTMLKKIFSSISAHLNRMATEFRIV